MTSPSSQTGGRSLTRAALVGLGGGLLLGSVYLLVSALRASRLDCAGLPMDECELEQQMAVEIGRYQSLFAAALALFAVAIFLWLRAKAREPKAPGTR